MTTKPKYDPNIHHRRSIRLKGYDYSSPGFYYVTICLQNRAHRFGKVENGMMILNPAGWPPFDRKLWQRNYYEHIVRSADELIRIQNYIINNPIVWDRDPECR